MECNKDDALRAKELAEKKFLEMDLAGAKRFALKAQELYPGLDGLSQLLATLEVYVAAEKKINGEIDWYKVLGVDPLADDETIRRHYRKMALILHPDKNKSVGSEGAFKLISQAWSLFSDKGKRLFYDQRCNVRGSFQEVSNRNPSVPASQNGFFNIFNTANWKARDHATAVHPNPTPASPVSLKQSFWTICGACKTMFEYPTVYLNSNLVCNCCHEPFLASETPHPSIFCNGLRAETQKKKFKSTRMEENGYVSGRPQTCSINSLGNLYGSKPFAMPGGTASVSGRIPTSSINSLENLYGSKSFTMPGGTANVSGRAPISSANSLENLYGSRTFTMPGGTANVSGRIPTSSINSLEDLYGPKPSAMSFGAANVPRSASSTAKAPSDFGFTSENLKRRYEDAFPPTMMGKAHCGKTHDTETTAHNPDSQSSSFDLDTVLKEDRPRKKRNVDENGDDSDKRELETKIASQTEGIRLAGECGFLKGNMGIERVNPVGSYKRSGMRDMSQQKLKMALMEKARNDIRSKLEELNFAYVPRKIDNSKKPDEKAKEKDNNRSRNGVEKIQGFVDSETTAKKSSSVDPDMSTLEAADSLSMSVPDPDFHNFDNDRTEKSFGANQVWAAYDDDDGMPRYYAMIHSVISRKPFKMRMSWLNSKSNDELAPIKWVGCGFPKTSGDFWIGKRELNGSLNSFSHRVKWSKGTRGVIQIYPKKGDVWALYRNWSLDWNELTPDDIVQKYDMVEVLEDYNEGQGVNVSPLIKVAGFKTVFRQFADSKKIKSIPREEMFRFSHLVPCYSLTDQDGHNVPPGCLELDPAAVPMELLQVVSEDLETVTTVENSSEDRLKGREIPKDGDLMKSRQPVKEEDIPKKVMVEPMRKESRLENLIVYRRKRAREKTVIQVARKC
ncbi:hypothetical protein QN277_025688 [Acacia crassicarpa]|uniref:J domain-containing protein n=1 Tax=Acacia crassicarpa TaxID=499986 RepID=A0AAE1J8I8_9FABA|nr:hypothetical protein QN277_025688 [Acacia crassicarpa]